MSYPITAESQIYQNVELLTIHDEFVKDVEKIRSDYDIDWIRGDEEEVAENYFFGKDEYISKMYAHHLNSSEYREILDFDSDTNEIIYSESEIYKRFKKTISELLSKYHLPKEYHEPVDVYVQQDFIPDIYLLKRGNFDTPFFDRKEGCVVVKVYPSTSKKDYNFGWKVSQLMLEDMKTNGPRKRMDNLSRDIKIVKLKKSGKTASQIAKMINKEYKLSGDDALMYNDINLIIYRTKKMLEKLIAIENSEM